MEKISADVKKRIELVKSSVEPEELRKNLCPFFEKGGCQDCIACDKSEAALEECKEIYLERIVTMPIVVWNEDFEKPIAYGREKSSPDDIVGIGMNCNSCYMSEKCPFYKKDYACGIDWGSSKPTNPTQFMDFLIGLQYERVRRSSVFEKIDGGVPDAGLSSEIDRLHNLIISKSELGRERFSLSVEATGAPQPSSGGGILAKLFGGGSTPELPDKKPITIPAKDVSDAVEVKPEPVKVPRQRKK